MLIQIRDKTMADKLMLIPNDDTQIAPSMINESPALLNKLRISYGLCKSGKSCAIHQIRDFVICFNFKIAHCLFNL